MADAVPPARLDAQGDLDTGLAALAELDPGLRPVIERAGRFGLRRSEPGFAGLASIILGQQISSRAADAIRARLKLAVTPLDAPTFLEASDEMLRGVGLSGAKVRTLRGLAEACANGFDLDGLTALPAEEAIAAMSAHRGVGRWTAEVYLLFCAGHPDIFPAGDLALMNAHAHARGLEERPPERELRAAAEAWSPWRGVAAHLYWAYHHAIRGRAAAPVGENA